jgi:hypothetical protein
MTPVDQKRLEIEATAREAHNLRVYVIGGGFQYMKMFYDAGFKGARNVNEADIVCFTGGEDVTPELYGEKALPETYFSRERDEFETKLYKEALELKKPMVGICRGGQFLNVMNDGRLWQDVNNHGVRGGHSVINLKTGEELQDMTSTHHQMMIPGDNAEVLALAKCATHKKGEKEEVVRNKPELDDTEVVWYPGTLSLCFQPHPEFAHGNCRDFFLELVDEYIIPAT